MGTAVSGPRAGRRLAAASGGTARREGRNIDGIE